MRASRLRRSSWIALLSAVFAGFYPQRLVPQGTSANEYDIRAAMLFNLTQFIDWPAWKLDSSHPQFLICIAGQDPIGPKIDHYLTDKIVGTKPVLVRHLSMLENANSCHMLYVSEGERKRLQQMEPELIKSAVLTISERANAISPDQIVGLPITDEHVHIDINLGTAQRAGLTVSSKLLRLATVTR